jgi:very-short-patch-repair endonuclease
MGLDPRTVGAQRGVMDRLRRLGTAAHTREGTESRAYRDQACRREDRRDQRVAAQASGQKGVITTQELRACGLSAHAVSRRVRKGTLHPKYHGVYAVGHPHLSLHGRFVAAVKACGPGAGLSHLAAAARDGYAEWKERDIDVTVPRGRRSAHPGICIHRSSHVCRGDFAARDGVWVTKPSWTIVALAAVLPEDELRRVARQALANRLTSIPGLIGVLDRVGPARGTRKLRRILARGAVPTRSELEDVVYELIVAGGFEPPAVNVPLRLDGRVVIPDFRWPEQRLIVEADGAKWHDNALARASDAERQRLLEQHGETVLRVRWDEAIERPARAQHRFAKAGAPMR